ncbi:hypothetical protein AGMMS50212_09430 [Spirochaetia bacterium]|nr:hypothetical protein AGMMS50212_09430 [Spirochaetia bacterium]
MITKVGDILAKVFDNNVQQTLRTHSRIYKSWDQIICEAFLGKNYEYNSEYESALPLLQREAREKNRVYAGKLSDHSKIKDIKNKVLLVEADHSGWIQILQSKQDKILKIVKKEYKDIEINGIGLVLSKEKIAAENEALKPEIENSNGKEKTHFDDTDDNTNDARYEKIKDEKLKNILKRLEKQTLELEKQNGR